MMKNKREVNLISEERRTHDLQSAAKTVMSLAKKLLGKNGFVEVDLLSEWREIVGDEVASYSFPKQLIRNKNKDCCLVVEVSSGAFALELQLKEKNIVARVNAFFGDFIVNRIKIVQNTQMMLPKGEDVGNEQKTLVTEDEENYISELIDGLANKELQESLANLGRFVICANKEEKNDEI